MNFQGGKLVLALIAGFALAGCQTQGDSALETTRGAEIVPQDDTQLLALKGIKAQDIKARLGNPAFVRRDVDAEIWQYYADDCVLDLFLLGPRGGQKNVVHVEFRAHGYKPIANRRCLNKILGTARS